MPNMGGLLYYGFLLSGMIAGGAWLVTAYQLRHYWWGPENVVRWRGLISVLRFAALATGITMLLNVGRHPARFF